MIIFHYSTQTDIENLFRNPIFQESHEAQSNKRKERMQYHHLLRTCSRHFSEVVNKENTFFRLDIQNSIDDNFQNAEFNNIFNSTISLFFFQERVHKAQQANIFPKKNDVIKSNFDSI
jgi:hypothetical protein